MKTSCFTILCLLFFTAANLQADVILTVEVDPPVNAGTVASVSFFARSNTNQQITGVNLPIDIGPVGTALPPELSFFAAPDDSIVNEIGGVPGGLNVAAAILAINNTDAVANVTGFAPVTLTTSDTLLFDLLLNVDPSATPGIFPVSINSGDAPGNGFSFNIAGGDGTEIASSDITVVNGSVEIVPEPMSAIPMLIGASILGLRRKR